MIIKSTIDSSKNWGSVVARYVQFSDVDATHNIWYLPMGLFLELWRREKRLNLRVSRWFKPFASIQNIRIL